MRRILPTFIFVALFCACSTGGAGNRAPEAPRPAAPQAAAAPIIEVPLALQNAPLPRRAIAHGLRNPRGVLALPEGGLLVAEAGTGSTSDALSGRLLRLQDRDHNGDYDGPGERVVVLDRQPSKNLIEIVRRDEVFGMAGVEEGGGETLVSLAFFGGPSTIFKVAADTVTVWGKTHTNINGLAYDPGRRQWFGVASTSDEVVRLVPGGTTERIVKITPLENGQDAVPADLRSDPLGGELLVTLFTGSPEGEEGGKGVEIKRRAGGIIAVRPETKSYRWLVRGLTVPTDLEVMPDGTIYVLEFCDEFLDPAPNVEALLAQPSHGGFKHFSGRLLRIDRASGTTTVVAEGLDTPTNLSRGKDVLYVSEGMGTPGRQIPGPNGPVKLDGVIDQVALGPSAPDLAERR